MKNSTQKTLARLSVLIGFMALTYGLSTYTAYRDADDQWAQITRTFDQQIENPELVMTNAVFKELYVEFKGFKPSGQQYSGWNALLHWFGFSMLCIGAGSWALRHLSKENGAN